MHGALLWPRLFEMETDAFMASVSAGVTHLPGMMASETPLAARATPDKKCFLR